MDVSLSISYPKKQLVEKADWMADNDSKQCIVCNDVFTTFNRRHHCRRCGRIMCSKCCPKYDSDRMCIVCQSVIELSDSQLSAEEFQIDQYLSNASLLSIINNNDFLLYGELIRLFQNSLRNEAVRQKLLNDWPVFFQKVIALLKQSIEKMQATEQFFEQQAFSVAEAQTALLSCLGLVINFTASTSQKYAKYLVETFLIVDYLVDAIKPSLDLTRLEQVAWALRNLCYCKEGAKQLINNPAFTGIIHHLLTGTQNTVEHAYSIIVSCTRHYPNTSELVFPLRTSGKVAKYDFLKQLSTIQKLQPIQQGLLFKIFGDMCTCPDIIAQLQSSPLFVTIIDTINQFSKPGRDLDDLNTILVGSFEALQLILDTYSEDEDFIAKFCKLFTKTTVEVICQNLTNSDSGCSLYAAKLLQRAFIANRDVFYGLIKTKKNRELFVNAAVQLQTQKFLFDESKDFVKEVLDQIGKGDEEGIYREIKKRVKALKEDE
ncbi:FYVE_zinc finger domain-containing protein [Hexamita inflata]|uniref:FYVE zinc finger domain-containing protein n=1 Tax=Hexamita inflata TaxID=28002 RepID=A0AA86NZI4_9EUKA|nr:FYVE zinc finger domain-containing protein [Hexamita inflata]